MRFWNGQEGLGLAEYALIIALIAVVIALAMPGVTETLTDAFNKILTKL